MQKIKFSFVILFVMLVVALGKVMAQDAHFSQYYASYLYLNPAMAGIENDITFSSNFRQQWRSIVQPYLTNQISVTSPINTKGVIPKKIGGAGLSVYNDRAGDGNLRTFGANLTFAYNIEMGEGKRALAFGAQAGLIQKSIDFTNLQWGSQYNPYVGFDATVNPSVEQLNNNRMFLDLGAGFMFYHNPNGDPLLGKTTAYIGGAVAHINQPNESLVEGKDFNLPMLIKGHGGLTYRFSERFGLSPNFLVMGQSSILHINAGLYANYRVISNPMGMLANTDVIFGAWHRLEDSFIVMTGISNDTYTIGLSYDLNSSGLRYYTGGMGAFEVSLTLRRVSETKSRRYDTPRI